jgi:hypothetical protein
MPVLAHSVSRSPRPPIFGSVRGLNRSVHQSNRREPLSAHSELAQPKCGSNRLQRSKGTFPIVRDPPNRNPCPGNAFRPRRERRHRWMSGSFRCANPFRSTANMPRLHRDAGFVPRADTLSIWTVSPRFTMFGHANVCFHVQGTWAFDRTRLIVALKSASEHLNSALLATTNVFWPSAVSWMTPRPVGFHPSSPG